MTLNAVAYKRLYSEEVQIIESMRRFYITNDSFFLKRISTQYADLIDKPMNQFLLILWKHDPSVLDLCKQNDTEVSIFELQLLYCIEKCRIGHRKTVHNLLSWWFPVSDEKASYALINLMAETLNEVGMVSLSADRLIALILSLISNNKGKPKLYLIEGGKSNSSFNSAIGRKNYEK